MRQPKLGQLDRIPFPLDNSLNSRLPNLTASGQRVCSRFEAVCSGDDLSDLGHLVFALLSEESIGGTCLHRLGLTMEVLASGVFGEPVVEAARGVLAGEISSENSQGRKSSASGDLLTPWIAPDWYVVLQDRAFAIAKRSGDGLTVGSEHLVLAMTEVDGFVRDALAQHGVAHDVVAGLLGEDAPVECLKVDLTLQLDGEQVGQSLEREAEASTKPSAVSGVFERDEDDIPNAGGVASTWNHRVFALLDANLNRVREGLRVLEDSARFVLCDEPATERLKGLRHRLVEEELRLRAQHPLIQRRDVVSDAGTGVTTSNEKRRSGLGDVLTANCRRMQEALRSLEEFSKLVDTRFSEACKQIRYQIYEAEQQLEQLMAASRSTNVLPGRSLPRSRDDRLSLLQKSSVYVLLTEALCMAPWKQTAETVLQAGADVLQLREKELSTAELIRRSEWLRDLCAEHSALFIMNDNAELAAACRADGVHLGQTDVSVAEARNALYPDQLIGLSTHNLQQLKAAHELNVDYLGVGPMFSTSTKSFNSFSGPDYASQASQYSALPWFAIGGINADNLRQLTDCGVSRIAVCGTVISVADPDVAVRQLRDGLPAADRLRG